MTTITTTVRAFRRWVEPALATTGADDMLPVLCHVRMEVGQAHALLTSTDRFRASLSRLRYDPTDMTPDTVHLHRDHLTRALAVFKAGRGKVDPALRIEVTRERVRFVGGDVAFDAATLEGQTDRLAHRSTGVEVGYPDIKSLFRQAKQADPKAPFNAPMFVNFTFLVAFKAAIRPHEEVTVVQVPGGASKPYVIRVGEDYLGLLMPRRGDESRTDAATDGWDDVLADPANKKEKSA